MKELELGAKPLTLEEVSEVARSHRKVKLSKAAVTKIQKSYDFLQKEMKKGESIYGVNTGFGLLSNVKIPLKDLSKLQVNLLRSHAVGTGNPISEAEVRAMLLLRAASLAQGHSGVRVELVEKLLELLNKNITPYVPRQGSVGASGDLAPLSHLALPLIGEGKILNGDSGVDAGPALKKAGFKPIELGPKEGLALINGTQFMTALGALAILEAEYLADCADLFGAMTLEALKGTPVAFSKNIQDVRPHPGQVLVAANMRNLLAPGGKVSEIAKSHADCGKVQDPYSLRCIPQVHGASRDVFTFVRSVLEREINSVTDNPLVFPGSGEVLSGGNFHGQIVAMTMDFMAIACAELASISEQRIEKLVNPAISGLPAFLVKEGGINSGYMIIQVAAASIVSENKTLCHPASVDSIPTSADKEDHVSMGAWAATKAKRVVANLRRVLAMEAMAAAQGMEFHRPLKSTALIEKAFQVVRKSAPFAKEDRFFHPDIEAVEKAIIQRTF